ncbi:MAG: hypothetical protein ACO24Y_10030 [Hylemonella sp.]
MRTSNLLLILLAQTFYLAGPSVAQAQAPTSATDQGGRLEQRTEQIRHEDAGSRIDELRVGGETRSITVQPKGGAPAYDITPDSTNRNPATADRDRSTGGSGGWKIKSF